MLKALEISGFKSFADKTRFEFPPGITVVVGPNGSGKSNIVDAIKWVLGEQSAKSLRGKDMSDVIFKGSSGTGARKPSNAATATLILENKDRRFPFDADEVLVGRRVYRSGETEYLINNETSRLKDIKNLFRGTGIGTDAYSLIEQGKVDRLLQANAKDRRAIFEEAAGISRFKAKKIEAERRLGRVEANLVRLADIVEEVGSRYRRVKSQATKAVKYKEYTERLQQLRTFVGMKDWRAFSEKLENNTREVETHQKRCAELRDSIEERETELKSLESQLDKLSNDLQTQQEAAANQREKIAQTESIVTLNESRVKDLEDRKDNLKQQYERSSQRTEELERQIETTSRELETAEKDFADATQQLERFEAKLVQLGNEMNSLRQESNDKRKQHSELIELVTEIGRLVSAGDTQFCALTESSQKYQEEVKQTTQSANELEKSLASIADRQKALQQEAESSDSQLSEARHQFDQLQSDLGSHQENLANLTTQHAGLSQRAEVIEELEKRLEGINAGARELLQRAKMDRNGPLAEVVGLVADLIKVNVQHAGIVDVALGEAAQYVVVNGTELINLVAQEKIRFQGRVGLVQLNAPPTLGTDSDIPFEEIEGVVGRIDRLVQVEPQFDGFVRKILGGTWVVKTLADGLRLHHNRRGKARFVTLDGEVVEADGTVFAGPKASQLGLVSRRSELRALHRELERIRNEIEAAQSSVKQLQAQVSESQANVQSIIERNQELSAHLAEQNSLAATTRRQLQQAHGKTRSGSTGFH